MHNPVDLDAYIDGTTRRTRAVTTVLAGQVLYAATDGLRPGTSLFDSQASRAVGVAENSAIPGDDLLVVTDGLWRGTTPWPVGSPLFLGPDSYPTVDPNTGTTCLLIGHVPENGLIQVRIGLPIAHGGA